MQEYLHFSFYWKSSFTHASEIIGTYHLYIKHGVKGVYQFLYVTEWYTIHSIQTSLSCSPLTSKWNFFCVLISCTMLNEMQVWTEVSVTVGSTEFLMPLWFNIDLSCRRKCSPPKNPSSIKISHMNPPKPPLWLPSNDL